MSINIDWDQLGFSYLQTACHIQYTWKDGQWNEGELVESPYMNLHIAATALHYGQAAFEGLKAFMGKDGSVRAFRLKDNAERINLSARRICMAEIPEEMFIDAVRRVVTANKDYVPPYGTGGSLYIRPLLFGSSPEIGIRPASEYTFIVMVLPVGAYYKGGLNPVSAIILDQYDRAAPQGVGHVKVAGNYAASLEPHQKAVDMGYPVELYLDAKEHKYIEEFGTSNFIGITKDNKFITPSSNSILASITNKTLQAIAADMGMTVESRPVEFSEIDIFSEIGACGTAVVVTPINKIIRDEKTYNIGDEGAERPVLQQLYNTVTGIQYGEIEDKHGWTEKIC